MWYNLRRPQRTHVPVCRLVRQRGALFVLHVPSVDDSPLDIDEDFELSPVGVDVSCHKVASAAHLQLRPRTEKTKNRIIDANAFRTKMSLSVFFMFPIAFQKLGVI